MEAVASFAFRGVAAADVLPLLQHRPRHSESESELMTVVQRPLRNRVECSVCTGVASCALRHQHHCHCRWMGGRHRLRFAIWQGAESVMKSRWPGHRSNTQRSQRRPRSRSHSLERVTGSCHSHLEGRAVDGSLPATNRCRRCFAVWIPCLLVWQS